MSKKVAAIVALVMIVLLSVAGCITNPSSPTMTKTETAGTSRFTPNKWAAFNLAQPELLNAGMLAYLEANKWGLLLYTDQWGSVASYKAATDALFTNIQNNYHIPIMLNLNPISEHWAWGRDHPPAFYESTYGPIMNYTETWANGTRGDCLYGYWYENGWPAFASWLRNRTDLKIVMGIYNYWSSNMGSTCGHDVVGPSGDWLTGMPGTTRTSLATRFAEVDAVDIEIWYTSDVPIMTDCIHYIKTCYPNMSIGIDSQDQGGFNINLWGSAAGLTDHPTTYAEQRTDYRIYIGQLKTALGRPFDTLVAEFSGDNPYHVGWTEDQIIQDQLQYELNSGWITATPTPTPTPTPI